MREVEAKDASEGEMEPSHFLEGRGSQPGVTLAHWEYMAMEIFLIHGRGRWAVRGGAMDGV